MDGRHRQISGCQRHWNVHIRKPDGYARTNDPFTKVGKQQIAVDVSSVIRASPDSFRVSWTERRFENGALAATERWTAILTIAVQPPRDAERLKANPLGIYVNAISWSREMGQ